MINEKKYEGIFKPLVTPAPEGVLLDDTQKQNIDIILKTPPRGTPAPPGMLNDNRDKIVKGRNVTYAGPGIHLSSGSTVGAGAQSMTFDGVTEGIDRDAMQTYLENLKIELLDTVKEQIDNVEDIIGTINSGWQGASRDAFLKQFAAARGRIKDDLSKEYSDLMTRFQELEEFYYKQDELLMDIIN